MGRMKSAYELAMERLNKTAPVEKLTAAQKKEIAGLNEKYQATGAGPVLLIGVAGVFIVIFIVGILAAIAIPAYQDYTLRARAVQAMQQAEPLRREVGIGARA